MCKIYDWKTERERRPLKSAWEVHRERIRNGGQSIRGLRERRRRDNDNRVATWAYRAPEQGN